MPRVPPRQSPERRPAVPQGRLTLAEGVHALVHRAFGAVLAPDARAWVLAAVGTAMALLLAAILSFGPIVRARITKEAAARHVDVSVGSVRPGFFAITLRNVHVRPEGISGIDVVLDDVRVGLSATLSPREVIARGGEVRIDGDPEDLAERVRHLRPKKDEPTAEKGHRRLPLSVEGLSASWTIPSGGQVHASGVAVSRGDDLIRVGAARAKASHPRGAIEIVDGSLELGADGSLRRISADSLHAEQATAPKPTETQPANAKAAATDAAPTPPPLPSLSRTAQRRSGLAIARGAKSTTVAARSEGPEEPVLPLPDLHALRARIGAVADLLGRRMPEGSTVEIGGLAARLDVGGEPFSFGPAPLTVARHGDVVRLTFASDADRVTAGERHTPGGSAPNAPPLSVEAEIPLRDGDVTVRLSGGPVSLAMLGVEEGTKGLFDVAQGRVAGKGQLVLSSRGDALTFDGRVALHALSLDQPRLSTEPLRGIEFAASGRGMLDDTGRLRIDDAQLDMGALHVHAHGTVEETRDHFGVAITADVATAACQALLESVPQGLLPTVRSARMGGTLGATAHVVFDTRAIEKLVLEYRVDDRCRMTEVPTDLSRERFSGAFTYRTVHPDGTPSETTTGPGTPDWTDLDAISPFMIAAVLTTEDGAFYKHHGFNHAAIRGSVAANLKARRFVRGASTITMQLAKNLFLSRAKTLSRKIEEVVLTDYLEQEFQKDDMMELYLNVVEFGPDIYGITRAADYYFGRKPEELTLPECFFLASLMPSPIRYGRQREKGQASEGWMNHVHALMSIAAKNGKVSNAELAEGLTQPVVFYKEGDARPEPRKPVSGTRRDPFGDDSGWKPID